MSISFKKLKRNRTLLHSNFIDNNGVVVTKQDCKIYVPYDYLKYRLLIISDKTQMLAVAAVVIGDEFGILNGCCSITITPEVVKQVMIDGEEYMEFSFSAGSVVFPSNVTVKDSDLVYDMYKYFYSQGRKPAYLDADDFGNIFLFHKEFSGLNLGSTNVPFEIVASIISRDKENIFTYYRQSDQKYPPVIVPFNSVLFNARTTTAKLLGANLEDGVTSALVNPTTETDRLENLLRI